MLLSMTRTQAILVVLGGIVDDSADSQLGLLYSISIISRHILSVGFFT